jgi:dolichyl-phosphate beta-glucosyltransferase
MLFQSISVIIPAYNEQSRLPNTIRRAYEYLSGMADDFEIIVVDDGSTDGTARSIKKAASELAGIKLVSNDTNRGKGFSVRRGVLASRGKLVLISDADLSTPIDDVEKLLPFVSEEFSMAVGSRALKESDVALRQTWYREGMGKIFNVFVRSVVFGGIHDTQCGFKLMNGDIAREVFKHCRINGFCFDVEALYVAKKMGYGIKEVPVKWVNSPASRVRIFRDSAKMFFDLFRIRAYGLLGFYDKSKQ